jgi:hypothetical protein
MAKVGRRTPYRAKFHNQNFLELSKQGKNITQIAAAWGVDRTTIYEWAKVHKDFSHTVEAGQALMEAWYTNLGHAAILGGTIKGPDGKPVPIDYRFFKWMTQNVCKWSEKVDQKTNSVVQAEVAFNEEKIKEKLKKIREEY